MAAARRQVSAKIVTVFNSLDSELQLAFLHAEELAQINIASLAELDLLTLVRLNRALDLYVGEQAAESLDRAGASARSVRYRFYFAVYEASGLRSGQIHVAAADERTAILAAKQRIDADQFISEPIFYLPEAMF